MMTWVTQTLDGYRTTFFDTLKPHFSGKLFPLVAWLDHCDFMIMAVKKLFVISHFNFEPTYKIVASLFIFTDKAVIQVIEVHFS